MTDKQAIVHNIKMARFDMGITQKDLAKKSKVSQSTIAHIEMGTKSPSIETLSKLAKALKLKTYELLKHELYAFYKQS